MARWAKGWGEGGGRRAVGALGGRWSRTGCGKQSAPLEQADKPPESAPAAAANSGSNPGALAAQPAGSDTESPPPRDAQHEPFDKATRGGDDPPPNSNPPPDRT